MTNLIKYDAACRALADAKAVDEVKDIRDQAMAMRLYARQAKNKELEADALEIRLRAERRVGEMMAAQASSVGLAQGRRSDLGFSETQVKSTLSDAGIDKNLANRARKLHALPAEEFERVISESREAIELGVERQVLRVVEAGDARERAISRTQQVAFDAAALGKFAVIYGDPPWRYENPPMGGSNRSIENHYPTMTLEEICALPVSEVAHDNSILFLWATAPKLAECFQVIEAWGFNYRTCMVWIKDKIGMGYHVRNRHEILLIAKRGELPPPAVENREDSVIEAPRLEHSAKPAAFRELIERMYPDLPRIELFAREVAAGWERWGNQAEAAE